MFGGKKNQNKKKNIVPLCLCVHCSGVIGPDWLSGRSEENHPEPWELWLLDAAPKTKTTPKTNFALRTNPHNILSLLFRRHFQTSVAGKQDIPNYLECHKTTQCLYNVLLAVNLHFHPPHPPHPLLSASFLAMVFVPCATLDNGV